MRGFCLLTLVTALLSAVCCDAQMTDSEKQDALAFMNFLRRNTVPRAGDMNGLLWDDKLAGLAQDAANAGKYQHNYDGPYAGLGENVYRGGKRNMTEILMFMFLERENYDFKTGACNINSASKYPMFTTCGHYLQLASANLMKVGCGLKLCDDGYYLVFCEFDRSYASPPYQAGEPGTLCQYQLATYSQNRLCYNKPVLGPAPVNGTLDCKITCFNYGTKTANDYLCTCNCPTGFYGARCEQKSAAVSTVPNDCKAQLVSCMNGGEPTLTDGVCKCVCPANYRGSACEENIPQVENSVFWYFGQQMHYASYYPVDPSIWTSKLVQNTMQIYLTPEVNAYCKANYQACCPNSDKATSDTNTVIDGNLHLTDSYPQNALDGSLKVGIHYRLPDALAAACGGTSPYVSRSVLLAAATKALTPVKTFLTYMTVSTIKVE